MIKLIAVLALTVAAFSVSPLAAGDAMVGYISDAKCATDSAKAKTAAEWIKPAAFENCVKECVKAGSDAVFLTENNKILKIDAASVARITPFLGRKVSITGKVDGTSVKVDTITGLKLQ